MHFVSLLDVFTFCCFLHSLNWIEYLKIDMKIWPKHVQLDPHQLDNGNKENVVGDEHANFHIIEGQESSRETMPKEFNNYLQW